MNKVYQHGDELFFTLDATNLMRNLRTGLTVRPRVPFKYLGEMPQVGQVWVGNLTKQGKTIQRIDGCRVYVKDSIGVEYEVRLGALLKNHTLQPDPFAWIADVVNDTFEQLGKSIKQLADDGYLVRPTDPHFATGHKDFLIAKSADRRYKLHDYQKAALDKLTQYCVKDVEAEAKARNSADLCMAPDGEVFRVNGTCHGWVGLSTVHEVLPSRCVREATFKAKYRALPLPGQLWAKGKRYVTVDRVEDGRVHYTGGASGLRRFLNEYANVTKTVDYRHIRPEQFDTPSAADAAKMFVAGFDLPTGAGRTVIMQQMLGQGFRQLCKPCHDRQKVEELARGYCGFTPCSEHVVMAQKFGRMLRPAPTTESMPCPLNTSTLDHLNTGNALDNWKQYRSTLGAKIRYANQRIRELSK